MCADEVLHFANEKNKNQRKLNAFRYNCCCCCCCWFCQFSLILMIPFVSNFCGFYNILPHDCYFDWFNRFIDANLDHKIETKRITKKKKYKRTKMMMISRTKKNANEIDRPRNNKRRQRHPIILYFVSIYFFLSFIRIKMITYN